MHITTIVGARPQFIKAAMVSKAFKDKEIPERLIHTGQHYDNSLSSIFFKELNIPEPSINLGIGSGSHAFQTGEALKAIEKELQSNRPEGVLVYGDTNSTLAGALAASKMGIPVFHVEAGLRSYNRSMPEEINRVLTDHVSNLLFAPTSKAVENLSKEGIFGDVHLTGDVMQDCLEFFKHKAEENSTILEKLSLEPKSYQLLTLHRPQNADDQEKLKTILDIVIESGVKTIFPVHPRTLKELSHFRSILEDNIHFLDPVGYYDSLMLQKNSIRVLTDSGGVQKEAYMLKVPCITIRTETEWTETTLEGWNRVVGKEVEKLREILADKSTQGPWAPHYGDAKASEHIADIIVDWLNQPNKKVLHHA